MAGGRAARGAQGGVQHPPRRRQRRPLREPQPRAADRRPARRGAREPPPAGRRDRDRSRARPDRQAGARRRGGSGTISRPSRRRTPNPAPGLPEADGQATARPDLAPLVFVADCLPVALAGPGGVAMIHCGWRGLAAGIVERGVEEVEAQSGGGRPRDRPVLLRGGRRGAGRLRAAGAGGRRGPDARPAPSGPAPARAGRGRVGRGLRGVHELPARALLLAPSRRRANGPPGGPRLG